MAIFNCYVSSPEGNYNISNLDKKNCMNLNHRLVGGDWTHGMDYDFPFSWEWKIIPSDEFTPSFFRGLNGLNGLNHQPD